MNTGRVSRNKLQPRVAAAGREVYASDFDRYIIFHRQYAFLTRKKQAYTFIRSHVRTKFLRLSAGDRVNPALTLIVDGNQRLAVGCNQEPDGVFASYRARLGGFEIEEIARGPKMIIDSHHQWSGILSFAASSGLEINPKLVVTLSDPFSGYEGGYERTRELLGAKLPFTAVVAFDDMTAFGCIRALIGAGRRVPADCSVIGFDDIPAAAFYNPALTSVREHMDTLASLGAEILLEAIRSHRRNAPVSPVHHKVKPELIIRESTAAPRTP